MWYMYTIHVQIPKSSHRISCFIFPLNIWTNYSTGRSALSTHTLYIMPRLYMDLWKGWKKRYYSSRQSLLLVKNEAHIKWKVWEHLWNRRSWELFWRRHTAFSGLGEDDKLNVVFLVASLLLHTLEHTIGQLRRQGAGHMQHIILICLASVASHFPTASAETPRVGGTGIKIVMELWDQTNHH